MSDPKTRVIYGEANYRALISNNGYYVDKTAYISLLENFRSPIFLRPRRFGKSLLCTTLEYYYGVNHAASFDSLFGHMRIGANPTSEHNSYFVLHFDFSGIDPSGTVEEIRIRFNNHVNTVLQVFTIVHRDRLPRPITVDLSADASDSLANLTGIVVGFGLPPFYIIIDEYDNFANQLIVDRKDQHYRELTGKGGFLKSFFKTLKTGRKNGTISRVFITGVLPITIDDLASGYNIADFITLDPRFEAMIGFTQSEVDHLLDRVYADYDIPSSTRVQVSEVIKNNYNGYHFVNPNGEALYNSTSLIYFLEKLAWFKEIPEFLTDLNLKTDISWIRRLTSSNTERTRELVDQLTIEGRLPYSKAQLREKFDMAQFFEKSFYPISFFYLGMLTRQDEFFMRLPNLSMKAIFSEYFNEVHEINVATLYSEMMSAFAQEPNLPQLFADYWRVYIGQLPEAVFASVNENFYRTTFYDICRQFLSHFYVWRMESSYASGRSDLEMEGKYHTRFAGDRYLMEFKYLSNAKQKAQILDIATFQPPEADWAQLRGYDRDQRQQYPEQRIQSYLIYCFGNKGFRVFLLAEDESKKT